MGDKIHSLHFVQKKLSDYSTQVDIFQGYSLFGTNFLPFVTILPLPLFPLNTVEGNTKSKFCSKKTFGRYPFDLTHLEGWSFILASDKLLNILHKTKIVHFVPHHLHWKHIRKGSLNVQYEQEQWLQWWLHWMIASKACFNVYKHLTVVFRQTWCEYWVFVASFCFFKFF